jgi:putative endonuclease
VQTGVLYFTAFLQHEKQPAVYIMASKRNGTLYIGVTSELWTRVANHKNEALKGFTSKYDVKMLVWYEHHHSMEAAIKREKQLKFWMRAWKLRIIEEMNPNWDDLHDMIDPIATLVDDAGN